MDFNKHESGTQRQIDRPQNVDELERFRDEILRALAPLEHKEARGRSTFVHTSFHSADRR